MKTVICAIAKCENDYINDWVNWHLNLGFDEIHIYDNNDKDFEPIESRIKIETGKVYIHKIPGRPVDNLQTWCYNNFYNKFKNNFDWCAYIDCDEFIELTKWKNIKDFLNDNKFKDFDVIRLNMRLFGDDDLVERDLSIPVYEGITKCLLTHRFSSGGKTILRGRLNKVEIKSAHYPLINSNIPKQINPDGLTGMWKIDELPDSKSAHINHYRTKTISEFIKQKLQRGDVTFRGKKINLWYFWECNKRTPEKLNYLKRMNLI